MKQCKRCIYKDDLSGCLLDECRVFIIRKIIKNNFTNTTANFGERLPPVSVKGYHLFR